VQERLRIARDLHDLLSYSLSAISLKTELTHRLLPGSVDRARRELTELQTITGRALIDADDATRGDSDVSLDRDGESVRSTLSASGIDGSVEIACGALPHETEAVLAIALREAATNILRHSKARNYLIEVTRDGAVVRLHVANDGALAEEEIDRDSDGSGLENLQTRVRGVGGTLTAGWDGDGWFHLWAVVPASVDDGTVPPDRRTSGIGDG
jgi:signal transduction histidine kinase